MRCEGGTECQKASSNDVSLSDTRVTNVCAQPRRARLSSITPVFDKSNAVALTSIEFNEGRTRIQRGRRPSREPDSHIRRRRELNSRFVNQLLAGHLLSALSSALTQTDADSA